MFALVVLAFVLAGAAFSTDGDAGEKVPPSVSALEQLPDTASVPPSAAQWFNQLKARGLTTPGLKRLRTNLGSRGTAVYAFENTRGGVCFLYVDYAGSCSSRAQLSRTGLQWVIGDGTMAAVVTDSVKEVELRVDGRLVPVSIANNVAFAEYGEGDSATIAVSYGRGAAEVTNIKLQAAFPKPPN